MMPKEVATIDWSAQRSAVRAELEAARHTFGGLIVAAGGGELDRPSNGTRWTNRELLFHMLFGYLVVRALLPMVKVFNGLPDGIGRGFAAVLNSATRPFNVVN